MWCWNLKSLFGRTRGPTRHLTPLSQPEPDSWHPDPTLRTGPVLDRPVCPLSSVTRLVNVSVDWTSPTLLTDLNSKIRSVWRREEEVTGRLQRAALPVSYSHYVYSACQQRGHFSLMSSGHEFDSCCHVESERRSLSSRTESASELQTFITHTLSWSLSSIVF